MRHAWVRPMRNIVSAVKKKKRKEKKTYLFISSPFKCPFLLCDVILKKKDNLGILED